MLLNCVKDFKYNLQNTGYTASNNCIDNHSKTFCDKLMIDLNSWAKRLLIYLIILSEGHILQVKNYTSTN